MKFDTKYKLTIEEHNKKVRKELDKLEELCSVMYKIRDKAMTERKFDLADKLKSYLWSLDETICEKLTALNWSLTRDFPVNPITLDGFNGSDEAMKIILREIEKLGIKVYPKYDENNREYKIYYFLG